MVVVLLYHESSRLSIYKVQHASRAIEEPQFQVVVPSLRAMLFLIGHTLLKLRLGGKIILYNMDAEQLIVAIVASVHRINGARYAI